MEYRPIARSSEIVVQEVGDETLVYDLKTHKAKCLNQTSAMIWKLCDGKKTAIEIMMALSAELKSKVDDNLVWLAFDQLNKEGLLEGAGEFTLSGTSRRELIKKVGFAAVIALPVVSSVVAPAAAQAASGAPPTPPCSSSNQQDCTCGPGGPSCQGACDASLAAYCAGIMTPTTKTCTPNQLQCQSGGPCNSVNAAAKCCVHNGSGVFGVPNWMPSQCN